MSQLRWKMIIRSSRRHSNLFQYGFNSNGNPFGEDPVMKTYVPANINANDFRKAARIKAGRELSQFQASDLKIYSNQNAFENNHEMTSTLQMHGLGKTESDPVIVSVPIEPHELASQYKSDKGMMHIWGISFHNPNLPRFHLVQLINKHLQSNRVVVISALTGKTSLLYLFRYYVKPEASCCLFIHAVNSITR